LSKQSKKWLPQRVDDGMLEVVGLKTMAHAGQWQVGLMDPIRLAQGKSVDIMLPQNDFLRPESVEMRKKKGLTTKNQPKEGYPVQIDGEPKILPHGCILQCKWRACYPVLVNSTVGDGERRDTRNWKRGRAANPMINNRSFTNLPGRLSVSKNIPLLQQHNYQDIHSNINYKSDDTIITSAKRYHLPPWFSVKNFETLGGGNYYTTSSSSRGIKRDDNNGERNMMELIRNGTIDKKPGCNILTCKKCSRK